MENEKKWQIVKIVDMVRISIQEKHFAIHVKGDEKKLYNKNSNKTLYYIR